MAYLLIMIFLALGIFFGGLKTHLPLISNIESSLTTKLFPKNEREILIDNLQNQQSVLNKFFSTTGQKVLQGKTLSEPEKQELQEAITTASQVQTTLNTLSEKEQADSSLVKNILVKTLDLNPTNNPLNPSPTSSPISPSTSVSPDCQVVCK